MTIPKPKRSGYHLAKNDRVVYFLNCLGKVIEKVASEFLGQYCEEQETLRPHRFGSRKRNPAVETGASLVDIVEEAWADKQIVGALCMDIAAAFPGVVEKCLLRKLKNARTDEDLAGWASNLMGERRFKMVIEGQKEAEMEVTTGLPQGSTVSPTLFAIYISEVHDVVEDKCDIASISFIDDVT